MTEREEQAQQWIRDRRHRNPEFRRGVEADLQKSVDGLGILCFSERPDDLLMWSYYASGHTGLCLEFALSRYEPFLGRAAPVHYEEEYPNINILLMSHEAQVKALLFTKAMPWKHEAEWRIIDHDKGTGVHPFPSHLLTGVILGCRTPAKVHDQIVTLAAARMPPPQLFQAVIRDRAFGVDVRAL